MARNSWTSNLASKVKEARESVQDAAKEARDALDMVVGDESADVTLETPEPPAKSGVGVGTVVAGVAGVGVLIWLARR